MNLFLKLTRWQAVQLLTLSLFMLAISLWLLKYERVMLVASFAKKIKVAPIRPFLRTPTDPSGDVNGSLNSGSTAHWPKISPDGRIQKYSPTE